MMQLWVLLGVYTVYICCLPNTLREKNRLTEKTDSTLNS